MRCHRHGYVANLNKTSIAREPSERCLKARPRILQPLASRWLNNGEVTLASYLSDRNLLLIRLNVIERSTVLSTRPDHHNAVGLNHST